MRFEDILKEIDMFLLFFSLLIIPLAILLYYLAVRSRKTYRCPQCGETIQVEYLKAEHCGMCGAPLKEEEM